MAMEMEGCSFSFKHRHLTFSTTKRKQGQGQTHRHPSNILFDSFSLSSLCPLPLLLLLPLFFLCPLLFCLRERESERERGRETHLHLPFSPMAITASANPSSSSFPFSPLNPLLHHSPSSSISFAVLNRRVTASTASNNKLILLSPLALNSFRARPMPRRLPPFVASAGGSGNGGGDYGGGGGGGGGGDDDAAGRNKSEVIRALAEAGRSLDNIPKDLAAAMEAGRIPGSIAARYFELEKSPVFRWLLRFGGFKERLLADDLFLTKVAIECGVGIFTKTAAELERRREKFTKELDFVFADVVMALIADFMLVWLPAPTVSLRPALAVSAGPVAKFFYGCPDNAFQVALAGTSYSFLQRVGAIVRNGAKLFAVGTGASLVGTGVTNALINVRKAIDKTFAGEAEDVPVLSTSIAYGVYMAVSSNLRYQVLAGVIEQRILEPFLHQHKVVLGAMCFAVRTGNTFLGSLMWVDYARWVGVQKIRD